MAAYSKAIAAFLATVAAVLGIWGIDPSWLTPELAAGITGALATLLVWLFPKNAA